MHTHEYGNKVPMKMVTNPKGNEMDVRERILKAAYALAAQHPFDKISFADVAKEVGVHWTVVRRHFGSKQEMRRVLAAKQAESGNALADTRTRILDAAARVFAEQGYAGATLDQVAADAGMTKGAVYWHFSGKSDLFLALCDRSLTQLLRSLPNQAQNVFSATDPMKALAALLQSQFACCEEGTSQPMLFFEFIASSRETAVREKLRETYAKLFDGTGAILREQQGSGLLAEDVDPQAFAILFHALVNGILLVWLIDPDRVQINSLVAKVSRVLWKGLEPQKAGTEANPL